MDHARDLEFIDVSDMPLETWLQLVRNVPAGKHFTNVAFPTEKHHDEYLETIAQRSEEDVCRLLYSFLIKTGTLGAFDKLRLDSLKYSRKHNPDIYQDQMKMQYYQRLVFNLTFDTLSQNRK